MKANKELTKEFHDTFNELDPYEQGKLAYRLELACLYKKGSTEAEEWRRGEIEASLEDE
jgi:hypothetical protein